MKQTKLYVAWFIITSYHWNAILAAEETSTISCIHELPLTSTMTKVIGYPVNIEMKTCRCGTIKEDTHNRFINAYAKFGSQCENVTTNSTGVCFNKTLNNIESAIDGWKEYSYAICLFQLTANETYKEISVREGNTFKRITTIGNRHVIDLPLNADVFIQDGILKKIDVIEGRCEEIKYLDGTYYTEKDMEKNLWKKKPSNIETGVDFELNDWFVIPNTTTSDLVGKYEENVDNITQNVCSSHYGPDFYSFNAKGTIPGSFKPGEEIGDRVDAESFKINTETIEIYENYKLPLRIENITSDKYFFFDGVIRNACDGNQYLVITNRSHDNQIIRGTIKVYQQESIIIALGKNSTKLDGKYTQDQLVGAHVKDDNSTYRMIAISNETCLEPINKGNTPTAIHIALSFTITLVTLGIVGIFVYKFWKRISENKNELSLEQPAPSPPGQSNAQTDPTETGNANNSQTQNPDPNLGTSSTSQSASGSGPHIPDEKKDTSPPLMFVCENISVNIATVNNGRDENSTIRSINQQNGQETTPTRDSQSATCNVSNEPNQIPNGSAHSQGYLSGVSRMWTWIRKII